MNLVRSGEDRPVGIGALDLAHCERDSRSRAFPNSGIPCLLIVGTLGVGSLPVLGLRLLVHIYLPPTPFAPPPTPLLLSSPPPPPSSSSSSWVSQSNPLIPPPIAVGGSLCSMGSCLPTLRLGPLLTSLPRSYAQNAIMFSRRVGR